MKCNCTKPHIDYTAPSFSLTLVWELWADSDYKVCYTDHDDGCVIARSVSGVGIIEMADNRLLELGAKTFTIIPKNQILSYYSTSVEWNLRWFEISAFKSDLFALGEVFESPLLPGEKDAFDSIMTSVRHPDPEYQAIANSELNSLLSKWYLKKKQLSADTFKIKQVMNLVDAMHKRMPLPWTANEMSKYAATSERQFRMTFTKSMGKTPVNYYNSMRVLHAQKLLEVSGKTIAEIADEMQFSSPFHFSRWFKKHVGEPPKVYRK